MVYYEYGIVLRKTTPQTNENQLIHTLFQKKFIQLPEKSFDWGSPYTGFNSSNINCVKIALTDNYIHIFSRQLQNQINIQQLYYPQVLNQNLTPVFIYDTLKQEFFLKENEATSYVWKDSSQSLELLKLSKRFKKLRIAEENGMDTLYCIMEGEQEIFLNEFELGNELITALLSERFEWPISNTKTSYYILYEDDLNLVDIDFFTGKTSKYFAENELKNWKNKNNLRFALGIWESISSNTKIVSFWEYIQVIIKLFIAMIILIFLALFKESEEQEFKRRFHIRLSIIVYSIFLIIGLVWINFVQRPESWKDLGKFFGFLLFGTWLGTRFLKLVLLKK